MIDYYDFLQISPDADTETIHRVYHYLATRFHPDNRKSGDAGMFRLLKTAHDVLTDRRRRGEYDAQRASQKNSPQPLSATVDFMDGSDGELNRRLTVLAVLYYQRRRNPNSPDVSLAEIELRMGFPRDYLDFTLWYLQKKNYVAKTDSAQYALTVDGVDFVESERAKLPVLNHLLTDGTGEDRYATVDVHIERHVQELPNVMSSAETAGQYKPVRLCVGAEELPDRRAERKDRRVGAPDRRVIKVERRGHVKDRRSDPAEQLRKLN
jgi:curved DNA-binding protein CbpA